MKRQASASTHKKLPTLTLIGIVIAIASFFTLFSAPVPTYAKVAAAAQCATSPSGQALPIGNLPGWRQVFTDDFSGTSLNGAVWGKYAGQPSNDPMGWWDPGHVAVNNCMLTLNGNYDSAIKPGIFVTAGVGFREVIPTPYGKYLIRMRVDKGDGISAIALLWPQAPVWPPEIDFYEDPGGDRKTTSATLHCGTNGNNSCIDHKRLTTFDFTQWHTVGIEWTKGQIKYTIDDTVWASINDSRVPSIPMNLALQLQALECGPYNTCVGAGTPAEVDMQVDWVAVYTPSTAGTGRAKTVGVYNNGVFYLRNSNSAGPADLTVAYNPSKVATSKLRPIVGDWDGDGVDTVGVYDTSLGAFYLSNSNTAPAVNYSLVMGNPGDQPLAGHWTNGMPGDGVGVYRPSNGLLYARKALSTGFADYTMVLGNPGDYGVAGDWDGDLFASMGIYRPSNNTFYLANQLAGSTGTPAILYSSYNFVFGNPSSYPVAGDWQGGGVTGVGYYMNGSFYLKNALGAGNADSIFAFGPVGSYPVAGHWTSTSAPAVAPNVLVPSGAGPAIKATDAPANGFE
jgi:hypothetical protein